MLCTLKLLLVGLSVVSCLNLRVSNCVRSYFSAISAELPPGYLEPIMQQYDSTLKIELPRSGAQVIVDAGLGVISSNQVFHTMMQLNVPSVHPLGTSTSDCIHTDTPHYSNDVSALLASGKGTVYVGTPLGAAWLRYFDAYPSARLIVNDVSDADYWFANMNSTECMSTNSILPDNCYAPLLAKFHGSSMPKVQLRHMSFRRFHKYSTAYRALVHCVAPPEQTYHYNVSQSSAEHWIGLTKFLQLNVTPSALDRLIDGGPIPIMVNHEVCRAKGRCYDYKIHQHIGPAPSVCDDPSNILPSSLFKRMSGCAASYADELADLFGSKYRTLIYNRMISAPNLWRAAPIDDWRIVLGVGPGTTGTSSLYTAMKMLNLTSHHYNQCSANCSGQPSRCRYLFEDNVDVLQSVGLDQPVFWADSPVPGRWWHVFRMYPRTKLIMTDVSNDTAWFHKRTKDHCRRKIKPEDNWDFCTVPLAVDFAQGASPLSREFFSAVHINYVSDPSLSDAAFASYRKLIKCAIPEEQVRWVNFKEDKNATDFWNGLVSFLNISVAANVLDTIIDAGIPYVGKSGCRIKGKKCTYEGRHNDTAITPSVCSIAPLPNIV